MDDGLDRARSLRKSLTDTERLLWSKLRGRRFGGFKFRRQVPLGPFIADFVCFEQRLIVELDGGQHTLQAGYDARVLRGWRSRDFVWCGSGITSCGKMVRRWTS